MSFNPDDSEISVLIIEDEEIWVKSLKLMLAEFGLKVAGTASNAEDALSLFSTASYDLILMDINLNGKTSGLELGRVVNRVYHKPFIFISANEGHTLEATIDARPAAYLSKPFHPASLYFAIQNAIRNFDTQDMETWTAGNEHDTTFFVKHGSKYKKIDWRDVVYLSAGKNYISIFNSVDKTEYYIRSSLQKTLQFIIPKELQGGFVQVNRSEIVQFSYIREVMNNEVKTDFKNFPVSDTYSKELRARLKIIS